MNLTVLGYNAPYPGVNQANPGYLLEHQNKYYLIDIGSGVLSRLQTIIDLNQIEGVFISHYHYDHMSDFFVLQYAMQLEFAMKKRSKPLPVYIPKEPKDMADIIPYKHFIETHFIDEQTEIHLQDLTVSFLQTDHPIPSYAMKFKSKDKVFVYGADSGIGTVWSTFADNADLLILECTYLNKDRPPNPAGHLGTIDVVNISKLVQPKQLLLTHFYPEYNENDIREEIIKMGINSNLKMPKFREVVKI